MAAMAIMAMDTPSRISKLYDIHRPGHINARSEGLLGLYSSIMVIGTPLLIDGWLQLIGLPHRFIDCSSINPLDLCALPTLNY